MIQGNSETFVLTGATGFLGSHLMAALLEQGQKLIILGRSSGGKSLAERIAATLEWFGLTDRLQQLETVEVNLARPELGLAAEQYHGLCARRGWIIHCASDTSFFEQNRSTSITTNVYGLRNMLEFARESATPAFHYVSTAYVAESSAETCFEEPAATTGFLNVYEETKAIAEWEVMARCGVYDIPYTIVRPSIVYGDSRHGRANRFNALYSHVKALYFIRDIYLTDLRCHGGHKSSSHGIYLEHDEVLHLPLQLALPRRGTINLIPVDYFVAATLAVLEQQPNNKIYHLTSDTPVTMEQLATYCETFLQLSGITITYGSQQDGIQLNPAEELFNRFVEPYRPYLADRRRFDRSNAAQATAELQPPDFSYPVFERCMNYAVSSGWGKYLTTM
jgi:nucleoside-diphosphate-sugar epimerase